jgi:hypothetical protein
MSSIILTLLGKQGRNTVAYIIKGPVAYIIKGPVPRTGPLGLKLTGGGPEPE